MSQRLVIPIYLETGQRRVFASGIDWPGWSRSGRDEESASRALAAAAPRYAVAARRAGLTFGPVDVGDFEVVQRLEGSPTTDFGVPSAAPACDAEPFDGQAAERFVVLLTAAWNVFDEVVERAPLELRKGPRGGGRNRDRIVEHVVNAEIAYFRKLGLRTPALDWRDSVAVAALRNTACSLLLTGMVHGAAAGLSWLPRYAARRIAWHVLDHAWEIEDKSTPGSPG